MLRRTFNQTNPQCRRLAFVAPTTTASSSRSAFFSAVAQTLSAYRSITGAGLGGKNNNNNGNQQQQMMYGAPPPPPPPYAQQPMYGQAYYGYAPPPPPSYYGYTAPPSSSYNPMLSGAPGADGGGAAGIPPLGSRDRPLVVVSPPAPRTLATRLWTFLILIIGVSAAIQLMDAVELRSGGVPGIGGAGGVGGSGSSVGGPSGKMASLFGVSEVKPTNLDAQTVTFADIQGCDEAKEELEDLVDFLKDPKKFQEMGARLPKGCLLTGPPGTGKTMLAKAIAKEAGVTFFYATGSEFDEMFVGVGSRRIRELFAAAKNAAPSLIFIDEIDALGGKRSSKDQSHNRQSLNQLLAEMDGFIATDSVVVIAATNTPDSLDKALTRPGRFDTTVTVDPPDLKGREAIVETYLNKIKHNATVSALDIAKGTTGMTGAELANLVNVAAIRAVVMGKKEVGSPEVDYAKDRVLMGAENRSKIIPENEKKTTAWHEGGHALVALLLAGDGGADPIHKATIVARGQALGLVQQQPDKDRYSQSKKQMMARLMVCLGGRVGEEILLGPEEVTSGASSDYTQATRLARAMVRKWGLSGELGPIDFSDADSAEGAYMSDETKAKIEHEVSELVNNAYKDTQTMLRANKDKLERIATTLLKHETLSGEQLQALVEGKPMPDSKLSTENRRQLKKDRRAAAGSNNNNGSGGGNSGGSEKSGDVTVTVLGPKKTKDSAQGPTPQ